MLPPPPLKNSTSIKSQRKSLDGMDKSLSSPMINQESKLGSSKKLTFDAHSSTFRKQIGQFIQKVAEEASQLKNQDEIIIKFSCSIISRYREELLRTRSNHKSLHEIQEIFNESASKTMQFLHYQYPKPEGRHSFDSNEARRQNIDPRYSIVHKILDHPFNKNKREEIRTDINFILHELISHSEDNFSNFQEKMIRIFQKGDKRQQQRLRLKSRSEIFKTQKQINNLSNSIIQQNPSANSNQNLHLNPPPHPHPQQSHKQNQSKNQNQKSSIGYRFSKRLSKNISFKNMNIKSPSFFRTDKDTISILMDWYYELKNYFNNPNLILKNKMGFRNQQGGITKLIYKDRVKLSKAFEIEALELKKSLEEEERNLREIILMIILISDRELQRQILKPQKQEEKKQQQNEEEKEKEQNLQKQQPPQPIQQKQHKNSRPSLSSQQPQTPFAQQMNKHYQYKSIHYLDKNQVSFVKICDDIYKAVNDHIMSILSIVIIHLKRVQEQYHKQTLQDMDSTQKLSLVTLTMYNIYKCQYIGSQTNINQTIKRIKQSKDIDILFEQKIDSNDTILNLIVNDSENKFPIISQIRFTSSSAMIPFSFPAFLLQQSSTPFGIIAELGLLFQNIDKRNKYILKNKIVYKRQQNNFQFLDGELKCRRNRSHQIKQGQISKPYICYVCFKYKYAYLLQYKSKYCSECNFHICPICYVLKLKTKTELIDYLLKDEFEELKQFFQIEKCFFTETSQDNVNAYLQQQFKKKEQKDQKALQNMPYDPQEMNISIRRQIDQTNQNMMKSGELYYGVFKIEYNQLMSQFLVVKNVNPVRIRIIKHKQKHRKNSFKQVDRSSCYFVQIENNEWSDEDEEYEQYQQQQEDLHSSKPSFKSQQQRQKESLKRKKKDEQKQKQKQRQRLSQENNQKQKIRKQEMQQNSFKQFLTFTNLPLNFKTRNNCIFLILSLKSQSKIIHKNEYLEKQKEKNNIKINSFHEKFSTQNEKLYVENSNENRNKFIIIDYNIAKKEIYHLISDNNTKILIKGIKNSDSKDQKLHLKYFAVNYNLLNSLTLEERERITVMNLNMSFAHTNESPEVPLSVIEMFPRLKLLRIDNTTLEIPRLKLPELQELYLQNCQTVNGLDFNDYKNIKNIVISPLKYKIPLPRLILQKLMIFELRGTSITSFQELQNSVFRNLNRITLTLSKIQKIPLFTGKSFEKLNVLEFRYLKNKQGKKTIPINASNIQFFNLPQLKYLIIVKSILSARFPKITNCPKLMSLRLSHNNIKKIQPFQCEELEELLLSNNSLTVLPEIICPKLITYNISYNQLTIEGVSPGLSKIYANSLDLTYNDELQKLPIIETKVDFIIIEKEKIYWEIQSSELSKVNPLIPALVTCDNQSDCQVETIRMTGRYSNDQKDYCIPCFQALMVQAKKKKPVDRKWIEQAKDYSMILTISKDMLNAKAVMDPQ